MTILNSILLVVIIIHSILCAIQKKKKMGNIIHENFMANSNTFSEIVSDY